MPIKALIFGNSIFYPTLKSFYDQEVQRGNLEIVGRAFLDNGGIKIQPVAKIGGGV